MEVNTEEIIVEAGVVVDFCVREKGKIKYVVEINGAHHFILGDHGSWVESAKEKFRRWRIQKNNIACVHINYEEWSELESLSLLEKERWIAKKIQISVEGSKSQAASMSASPHRTHQAIDRKNREEKMQIHNLRFQKENAQLIEKAKEMFLNKQKKEVKSVIEDFEKIQAEARLTKTKIEILAYKILFFSRARETSSYLRRSKKSFERS